MTTFFDQRNQNVENQINVGNSVTVEPIVKRYVVTEMFGPTMQGEGPVVGQLTAFLRLHYCGSNCIWCDTRYSWDKRDPDFNKFTKMTAKEIRDQLVKIHMKFPGDGNVTNRSRTVTISGGDPLIQLDDDIIDYLRAFFKLQIETQGMLYRSYLEKCRTVVMSPKPPSSGQPSLTDKQLSDYEMINTLGNLFFKVVIFTEEDFEWAYELYRRLHSLYAVKPRFYLQAGTPTSGDVTEELLNSYRTLVDRWLTSGVMQDAIVLPQVHALVWGRKKGI